MSPLLQRLPDGSDHYPDLVANPENIISVPPTDRDLVLTRMISHINGRIDNIALDGDHPGESGAGEELTAIDLRLEAQKFLDRGTPLTLRGLLKLCREYRITTRIITGRCEGKTLTTHLISAADWRLLLTHIGQTPSK